MAVTSEPTELGTALPDQRLRDLEGVERSLSGVADGRPLLVYFTANHCPYVRHVEDTLAAVLQDYTEGVAVAAIASNDVANYPDDDVEHLAEQAQRAGWTWPTFMDSDQRVARSFGAVCTPDFFVFDASAKLAYRGGIDDSTPGNGRPCTGEDLRKALDLVVDGQPVPLPHRPAMGCSIKWLDHR